MDLRHRTEVEASRVRAGIRRLRVVATVALIAVLLAMVLSLGAIRSTAKVSDGLELRVVRVLKRQFKD